MSDWTWEYLPDIAGVVGGLTSQQIAEVQALAARLVDAVGVCRIGSPFDPSRSRLQPEDVPLPPGIRRRPSQPSILTGGNAQIRR
jgi:hypothetical protein